MNFSEEKERVIYKNNPLVEVICQFRYPVVLRIVSVEPVDFQDKIRKEFPYFRENISSKVNLPSNIAQSLPQNILEAIGDEPIKSYQFTSSDETQTLSLTRDFLALTTNKYIGWEDFWEKMELSIQAFNSIYSPAFVSRVGLRYQNVIRLSSLGLKGTDWAELINPILAGFLTTDFNNEDVEDTTHMTLLNLENNMKVRIRYGLAKANDDGELCLFY